MLCQVRLLIKNAETIADFTIKPIHFPFIYFNGNWGGQIQAVTKMMNIRSGTQPDQSLSTLMAACLPEIQQQTYLDHQFTAEQNSPN